MFRLIVRIFEHPHKFIPNVCITQVPVQLLCAICPLSIQWQWRMLTLQEARTRNEWPFPWLLFWYHKQWYEAEGPWKALHIWQSVSVIVFIISKYIWPFWYSYCKLEITSISQVPFSLQHHVLLDHFTRQDMCFCFPHFSLSSSPI